MDIALCDHPAAGSGDGGVIPLVRIHDLAQVSGAVKLLGAIIFLAMLVFIVVRAEQGRAKFWKWHATHCNGCNFSHDPYSFDP